MWKTRKIAKSFNILNNFSTDFQHNIIASKASLHAPFKQLSTFQQPLLLLLELYIYCYVEKKRKFIKKDGSMKLLCGKLQLGILLTNIQKAVASKSTIPALEGILITATKQTIKLCAYNTELGITTTLPATVTQEGRIVINAHLLTEIIKKLPSETVEIEVKENFTGIIKGEQSTFELIGIDPKEFPELPNVSQAEYLTLPVSTLKSMIKQTIFAVADADAKPIHTGTLFEIKDNSISLVSVDGYRLALRNEPAKESLELKFVVPGKTLKEVLRLLPTTGEEENYAKITAGMRHIIFQVGEYKIISRLLEGEFLDYKTTIPERSTSTVKVSTAKFLEAIERVSLLINDRLKSPVKCIFSKESIILSCNTAIGKSNDEIKSVSNCDEELEIAFNNRYMIEALKSADCDEIEIHLNGSLSPIKITPTQGNSFVFLVLPVRIKPN